MSWFILPLKRIPNGSAWTFYLASALLTTAISKFIYSHLRMQARTPRDLIAWHQQPSSSDRWSRFARQLLHRGYELWDFHQTWYIPPMRFPKPSGYTFLNIRFPSDDWKRTIDRVLPCSGLIRPARAKNGMDVMLRLASLGDSEALECKILRQLCQGRVGLDPRNHVLPFIEELRLPGNAIIFVFPFVRSGVADVLSSFQDQTRGDLVHMLLQMFEAVAFLHEQDIAHQDIYEYNFLLEWVSQSRVNRCANIPRVFLIDYETAALLTPENRLVAHHPLGEHYPKKRLSPEAKIGQPYCPFKLDVWQLGITCDTLENVVPGFDALLSQMTNPDPQE